jgi:hypothetical protein
MDGSDEKDERPVECEWYEPYAKEWKGECGVKWHLGSMGPDVSRFKFCPECGRKVRLNHG